jgi:HSP20 family protein
MLPVKTALLPTVSRIFDDNWANLFDWTTPSLTQASGSIPSVNIKETPDAFLVEMAAPGMKKEDFQVELHNNVLTIKSEKQEDLEDDQNELFTRREYSYRSFKRTFNLNNQVVDDAKINAKYLDGILHITLPKKEEAKVKPARMIKIT